MVLSSTFSFVTSTHRGCKPRLVDLAAQVGDKILGPMPVQEFLKQFLPHLSENPPPLKSYQGEIEKMLASKDEPEMYGPLVKAIQSLCRNFSVVDTHDKPFPAFHKMRIKPDICIYPKNETGDISKVEMMIEVKYRNDCDPFLDSPDTHLVDVTELSNETLGQIASYASAHQAAQFRSYIFSLLVFPTYARILRWDRSGVIVTNKIPWSSTDLPDFFHRFDCMTAEQRGIDPTVTKPSSSNERRVRKILDIGNDTALMQISVGGSDYIVPRKVYMDTTTYSLLSRSTRPFHTYSLSKEKTVFLKDSWRLQTQTAEHKVYAELKKHEVPHIATILAGEDVLDRQTLTQDFAERKPIWAKNCPGNLRKHSHYRLVIEEVGSPLWKFSSTKSLVKILHDAMIAHKAAYEKANILHRDISVGNILIYEGSALLIDWDLSKSRKDIERETDPERTGTWQFRAARLLSHRVVEPHMFADDVESFVNVITWTAFKYAGHDMGNAHLTHFFQTTYDYSYLHDDKGHRVNSFADSRLLTTVPRQLEETEFKSENLKELLLQITHVVATRYRTSPLEEFTRDSQWRAWLHPDDLRRSLAECEEEEYQERLSEIRSPDWLIQRFLAALSQDNWPENDAAEEHEFVRIGPRSALDDDWDDDDEEEGNGQEEEKHQEKENVDESEVELDPELSGPPAKKQRLDTVDVKADE